jgi:type IV secretory pathway VirB6-like protein
MSIFNGWVGQIIVFIVVVVVLVWAAHQLGLHF